MKVSELETGMMLEPVGDSEVFLRVGPTSYNNLKQISYITVRSAGPNFFKDPRQSKTRMVMYLGTREDVKVSKDEMSWSDRYVLHNDEITAVDPSAWRRMKPVR